MAEFHAAPVYQEQLPVVQLELEGNPNSLSLRRPFDPVAHELDATFRLTRFADLKGWGCKVPQEVLSKLLEGLQQDDNSAQEYEPAHFMHMEIPRVGEYGFVPKGQRILHLSISRFYFVVCRPAFTRDITKMCEIVKYEFNSGFIFI